jgi:hypothetical protein
VVTEHTNFVGNEKYKSSHNVRSNEVWVDEIPYSADLDAATLNSASSSVVNQLGGLGTQVYLYPLTKSNYQTWFIDTGTPSIANDGFIPSNGWAKPMISPVDVSNDAGVPSGGYSLLMFPPTGGSSLSDRITYDNSFYEVDYFSGLIRFDVNKTPIDLAANSGLGFQFNQSNFENSGDKIAYINNTSTGGPRAIAFQYTGIKLSEMDLGVTYEAGTGLTISNNIISVNVDDETIGVDINNDIYIKGKTFYDRQTPLITTGDNQPTGVTLSHTPLKHIPIKVFVNGQAQEVGNNCYFYDNGVVDLESINLGDELYWNGIITGYDLENDDIILLIYNIVE